MNYEETQLLLQMLAEIISLLKKNGERHNNGILGNDDK